jgi:hypothetical protein
MRPISPTWRLLLSRIFFIFVIFLKYVFSINIYKSKYCKIVLLLPIESAGRTYPQLSWRNISYRQVNRQIFFFQLAHLASFGTTSPSAPKAVWSRFVPNGVKPNGFT